MVLQWTMEEVDTMGEALDTGDSPWIFCKKRASS
jgi:hypothetical protein